MNERDSESRSLAPLAKSALEDYERRFRHKKTTDRSDPNDLSLFRCL